MAGWLNGWLVEWLINCLLIAWLLGANIHQIGAKIHQVVVQNPPKSRCWGLLGALGEVLGGSWAQDLKMLNLQTKVTPLGGQVGAQNQSKSVPRAIRKAIIFLIDLKIDFWSDLVPTWPHLDPQNPPKMGSS